MIEIKMSSLGKIILKTLEQYYPFQKINLSTEEIDNILNKINIKKKNVSKKELSKVIAIIQNHIDNALQQDKVKGNIIQDSKKKYSKI
jgi:hypothetical protein